VRYGLAHLALLLVPLHAAAAPQLSHHPLHWFVVKEAEAPGRDLAYYSEQIAHASADADALLQGVQAAAPTDVACCASVDAAQIDEISQSELVAVDAMSDFDLMTNLCGTGTCAFLVDSITLCGGGAQAVGCSDQPLCNQSLDPLIVAISVDAVEGGYFGQVLAHEVGHTTCLAHDTSDTCDLMYPSVEPGTLQGCLSGPECDEYHQHSPALGPETCECHTDDQAPVADGAICSEGGEPGACASGLCLAPEPGPKALSLAVVAALGGLARWRAGAAPGTRATQLT